MYPLELRLLTARAAQIMFRMRFSPRTLEKVLRSLYFDKTLVTESIVEQYYAPFANKRVRDTLIMSMLHFDEEIFTRPALRGIKKETLIFSGENDPINSEQTAKKFTAISGAEHIKIRNCGHFANEEKPQRFNSETLLFLDRNIRDDIRRERL